jgi:hypothetical protein
MGGAQLNALHLTDDALQLFALCHQAGEHRYLWGHTGDPKSNGTSRWFRPGETPPVFNSTHNNYFGVHPTLAPGNQYQRAKKGVRDVAAINCLYADVDDKDHGGARGAARAVLEACIASGAIPQPTVIVDTGGGTQVYWGFREPFILDTPEKRERADRVQKAWVAFVGSDDGAKDAARVLRVPGTLNFKYNPPRPVTVLEADYSRLYDLDDLEALLPLEEVKPAKVRTPRQARSGAINVDCESKAPDFDSVAQAATNLKRLNPSRCDRYNDWIEVGMALFDLGAVGYNLWDLWSKISLKYQVGECADKWQTFKTGRDCGGITLASLARWADDDDPGGASALTPAAQRQLDDYKREEALRIDILRHPLLDNREKVAWLAMRTTIEVREILQKEGAVPLKGAELGRLMGQSQATGSRALRVLEEQNVLICDPVPFTHAEGWDGESMHVLRGPAYDDTTQVTPPTSKKKNGGKREGAGRKRDCPDCPRGTTHRKVVSTTVSYYCSTHGLVYEEQIPDEIEDYVSEGGEVNVASQEGDGSLDCNVASGYLADDTRPPINVDTPAVDVAVPTIIEETFDLTAAIRLADRYSPAEGMERYAFKTALSWLLKEPAKALDQVPKIDDPVARAIVEHLVSRQVYAQAVTS